MTSQLSLRSQAKLLGADIHKLYDALKMEFGRTVHRNKLRAVATHLVLVHGVKHARE